MTSALARLPSARQNNGFVTSALARLPSARQNNGFVTSALARLPTARQNNGFVTSALARLPTARQNNGFLHRTHFARTLQLYAGLRATASLLACMHNATIGLQSMGPCMVPRKRGTRIPHDLSSQDLQYPKQPTPNKYNADCRTLVYRIPHYISETFNETKLS